VGHAAGPHDGCQGGLHDSATVAQQDDVRRECGWCTDIHTKEAAAAGETPVRLNLVAAWRESTVFTEAERAALALTEEGTRLADAHHGVSDQTWAQVRKHYDDDQIAALVSVCQRSRTDGCSARSSQ